MALNILTDELEKLRENTSAIVEDQELSETDFNGQLQECFSKLIRIKTLAEKVFLRVSMEQLNTRKCKSISEKTLFKLQSLLYEKHLLVKEIESCENMETPEGDKVTLVDDKVFRKEAPKHIREKAKNSHSSFLAKLDYELHVRQELAKVYEEEKNNVSAAEKAMQ